MHEMSLMRKVLDIVLEECGDPRIRAVTSVKLVLGELDDVIEEYVPGLFRHLAKGTIAEGADVQIRRTPAVLRCSGCGEAFCVQMYNRKSWECPRCGAHIGFSILSGREFMVESIGVEMDQAQTA